MNDFSIMEANGAKCETPLNRDNLVECYLDYVPWSIVL